MLLLRLQPRQDDNERFIVSFLRHPEMTTCQCQDQFRSCNVVKVVLPQSLRIDDNLPFMFGVQTEVLGNHLDGQIADHDGCQS